MFFKNLRAESPNIFKLLVIMFVGVVLCIGMMPLTMYSAKQAALKAEQPAVTHGKIFPMLEQRPTLSPEVRKKAAADLQSFLNNTPIEGTSLIALNLKFLPVGVEYDGKGTVRVIPDDEWQKKLKDNAEILKALEQVRQQKLQEAKNNPQKLRENVLKEINANSGAVNSNSPVENKAAVTERSAPAIETVEEEEEEEEEYEMSYLTPRQQRIKKRELQIRSYLFNTYQKAINRVDRYGNRRSLVGDYLNDTIDHYKEETRRKDYYPPK